MTQETGTAYFDCLQLEEGSIANRYNLVENADFRYGSSTPDFWNRDPSLTSEDKLTVGTGDDFPANLDRNCFVMNGGSSKDKEINQLVNVKGKKGDTFVLSGWAKGNALPRKDNRQFALCVGISRTSGTTQWVTVPFNQDSSSWQFLSDVISPDADYNSIKIFALYYYEANDVYFDDIQLYKEEFGTSYSYDANGNLQKVADIAQKNSTFAFNNSNDLINSIAPKGGIFNYTYDSRHNVTEAYSGENNSYSFIYDSANGNPLTAQLAYGSQYIKSSTEYTDQTKNYVKTLTNSAGKTTAYDYYDETKGWLKSVTDPLQHKTNYGYDIMDRLTNANAQVDGQTVSNSYGYENDRLKTITHNGFDYTFGYDSLGNNTSVDVGTQRLITNSYDQRLGLLKQAQYGNNQTVSFDYDAKTDQIISKNFNGTKRFEYQYDASGNLGYQKDNVNSNTYRYIYDLSNRLVDMEDSKWGSQYYNYDLNNNLTNFSEKINNQRYSTFYNFDKDNRSKEVSYNRTSLADPNIEYFTLNGSAAGSNGTTPLTSGESYEEDGNGKTVLGSYEGTTNLLADTSFENTSTSWTTQEWSLPIGGVGRIINGGIDGGKCLEQLKTNQASGTQPTNTVSFQNVTLSSPLASSTTYELSAYVQKLGSPTITLELACYDSVGNTLSMANSPAAEPSPSNDQWVRISRQFTVPTGTKTIRVLLRSNVNSNEYVRFDTVQLEAKSFATAYANPTRGGTNLTYNFGINSSAGTMLTWFNTKVSGTTRYVIASKGTGTQIFYLYIGSDNRLWLAVRDPGGSWKNLVSPPDIISPNQWYQAGFTWYTNPGSPGLLNYTLYLNDRAYTASAATFQEFSGGTTGIGCIPDNNNQVNGQVEQVIYSPTVLTADNILKLYNNGRGNTLRYAYDRLGRLSRQVLNTGSSSFTTQYNYRDIIAGEKTTTQIESIQNGVDSIRYQYDDNGNIKTITNGSGMITYYYNELNELVREDNQVLNKTIEYQYDTGGNITGKREYAYTSGTLANPTKSYSYAYTDTNWKDKLTNFEGKEITYDEIGNPKTYDGWSFDWEEGRQLSNVSGNGYNISYKYNDAGIRTQKTVNGVTTSYRLVEDKVTYEDNGTDKIYYTYDAAGSLVSMNLNGTEYYYIRNAQGDIVGFFDGAGTQVVSYTYDSWGKLISIDGSKKDTVGVKNSYRYREYRYDTETGLYYLQSRYYCPEWGRFLNQDELMGETGDLLGHNMFVYCKNNPINLVDPNGDNPFILVYLYLMAIMASPDTQMDANNAMQSASQGDTLGASLDILAMGIPGVTGFGATKRVAVEVAENGLEVAKKVSMGRAGRQAKLRKLANDDKVSTALRGEIKRDINQIERGKRSTIRVPKGTQLAHRRGFEARKGFDYEHSDLQTTKNHWTQHKFDKNGRR